MQCETVWCNTNKTIQYLLRCLPCNAIQNPLQYDTKKCIIWGRTCPLLDHQPAREKCPQKVKMIALGWLWLAYGPQTGHINEKTKKRYKKTVFRVSISGFIFEAYVIAFFEQIPEYHFGNLWELFGQPEHVQHTFWGPKRHRKVVNWRGLWHDKNSALV